MADKKKKIKDFASCVGLFPEDDCKHLYIEEKINMLGLGRNKGNSKLKAFN